MKSIARILCCFVFLTVFAVTTANATSYPLYLQACSRGADYGFSCGSISYTGIANVSTSYLDSVLASYGCPYLGYGMYWCSTSNSALAQAYGYDLGIMSTTYSGNQYIANLYLFVFN